MAYITMNARCLLVIMNSTSSSDPIHFLTNNSPELAMLSDSVGGWKQYNVSHVSRQGGNFTESPLNRTLMLPAEEFDSLGGHTVWQVIIVVFLTGSLSLVTVIGNILVLVSFKINKALKTRTTKRAMTMIGLAWSISFILWAPSILFWQYIVGERTVQPYECYIQVLSEPIITFCTAIAAFYLPVTIMAFLFWKIYQETEKHAKDIQGLK
ncbi:hypothetical protein PAMP_010788 [Pampus punctatissimus]